MRVFVLDKNGKPLDSCNPARARKLLDARRAAVFQRFPFTIILKDRAIEDSVVHEHRVKIDPGSKLTGLAVVQEETGRVTFAAEVEHRGLVVKASLDRRCVVRRGRRQRKTRYRQSRPDNRTRPKGWLPPSLESRVGNVLTWVRRLIARVPVAALSQELVRFDMQQMENAEIRGVEYQQGTLAGYEVREYLLEKWHRKCAYSIRAIATRDRERLRTSWKAGPSGWPESFVRPRLRLWTPLQSMRRGGNCSTVSRRSGCRSNAGAEGAPSSTASGKASPRPIGLTRRAWACRAKTLTLIRLKRSWASRRWGWASAGFAVPTSPGSQSGGGSGPKKCGGFRPATSSARRSRPGSTRGVTSGVSRSGRRGHSRSVRLSSTPGMSGWFNVLTGTSTR